MAEPLNLHDTRAREVVVAFEVSPPDVPAQMNTRYTERLRAVLEPGMRASEVRVVIPAETVEQFLVSEQRPVPDSFSDFVWTFDVETGHVVSARLSGRLTPRLDWGFMKTDTHADIEIDMGTDRVAGFEKPKRVLGQLVFRYCTKLADARCRVVETAPYDRSTGYVNAVGQVWVHSAVLDLWNFSPLGEAIFSEVDLGYDLLANDEATGEFAGSQQLPLVSSPAPAERSDSDTLD